MSSIGPSTPVSISNGRVNTTPITVMTRENPTLATTRFPMTFSMVRWSHAPMARESTEADPMPIMAARPELTNVNGYATETAPMASTPIS